jgi:hypothetical protein
LVAATAPRKAATKRPPDPSFERCGGAWTDYRFSAVDPRCRAGRQTW